MAEEEIYDNRPRSLPWCDGCDHLDIRVEQGRWVNTCLHYGVILQKNKERLANCTAFMYPAWESEHKMLPKVKNRYQIAVAKTAVLLLCLVVGSQAGAIYKIGRDTITVSHLCYKTTFDTTLRYPITNLDLFECKEMIDQWINEFKWDKN